MSNLRRTLLRCLSPAVAVRRRGVAMLLVIISVMTATVLTMSYVSSRDNSAAIGQNAADAAAARWAASSGIDLAIAALQTEADWRRLHNSGLLIDNVSVNGSLLSVTVTDAATGQPPDDETVHVVVTTTATHGDFEQSARALATILPQSESVAQLDLGDFALFGAEKITLRNRAVAARWGSSPLAGWGLPVRIGVQNTNNDSIHFRNSGMVVDGQLFYSAGSSADVIGGSTDASTVETVEVIPFPVLPTPVAEPNGTNAGSFNINLMQIINVSMRWETLSVRNPSGDLTLGGNIVAVVDQDLEIQNGRSILVDGDVTLVVFQDLIMKRNASIALAPGATLRLFVGGDMTLEDAYIGETRADPSVFDISGYADWIDPNRIQIHSMSYNGVGGWVFKDQSVVKGSIYAPDAGVTLENTSAHYGRIAAREIELKDDAALFYCHMLDQFAGYCMSESVMYNADGTIKPEFGNLTTLSNSALQDLIDEHSMQLRLFGRKFGSRSSYTEVDYDAVSLGDPTPRPIVVRYELLSSGIEPRDWETDD